MTDPRARYRLWRWSEVRRWFETNYDSSPVQPPDHGYEQVAAAINASLELRHYGRFIRPEQRAKLQQLIGI